MSIYPYVETIFQIEYYSKKLTENIDSCISCLRHIIRILQTSPVESTVYTNKIYANIIAHCFSISEMKVKLLLHKFIYLACKDNEQSLMVCNSLLLDSRNQNPLIRKSALKTLALISAHADYDLKSQCQNMIANALEEPDNLVKSSVIMSIATIFRDQTVVSSELFAIIVNKLYSLIKHEDALIVFNSLVVLDSILEKEGGVVINKKIAQHLANLLDNFQELHKTLILKFIDKYQLKNMDSLKLEPKHYINFSCALPFINHLSSDIFKSKMYDLLLKSAYQNPEYSYLLLDWMMKNDYSIKDKSILFYETSDPWFLKIVKLSCSLVNFLRINNYDEILALKNIDLNTHMHVKVFGQLHDEYDYKKSQINDIASTEIGNNAGSVNDNAEKSDIDSSSTTHELFINKIDYIFDPEFNDNKDNHANYNKNNINSEPFNKEHSNANVKMIIRNNSSNLSNNSKTNNNNDFNGEYNNESFYLKKNSMNTNFGGINANNCKFNISNITDIHIMSCHKKPMGDKYSLGTENNDIHIHQSIELMEEAGYFASTIEELSILMKVEKQPLVLKAMLLTIIMSLFIHSHNEINSICTLQFIFKKIFPILKRHLASASYLITMMMEYLPLNYILDLDKKELIGFAENILFDCKNFNKNDEVNYEQMFSDFNFQYTINDEVNYEDIFKLESFLNNEDSYKDLNGRRNLNMIMKKIIKLNKGSILYLFFNKLLIRKLSPLFVILQFLSDKNIYCQQALNIVKKFLNQLSFLNRIQPSILIAQLEASMRIFDLAPLEGQMLLGRTFELCNKECFHFDEYCKQIRSIQGYEYKQMDGKFTSFNDQYDTNYISLNVDANSLRDTNINHLNRHKIPNFGDDNFVENMRYCRLDCESLVLEFNNLRRKININYKKLVQLVPGST